MTELSLEDRADVNEKARIATEIAFAEADMEYNKIRSRVMARVRERNESSVNTTKRAMQVSFGLIVAYSISAYLIVDYLGQ